MDFKITILGTSSAAPTLTRHQSAQVLTARNEHYLIDCGESVQVGLLKYRFNPNKIRKIFISHLHPDHFIGLIGFISTENLKHREKTLDVYGPEGLDEIIRVQLKHSSTTLRYPLNFHVIDPGKTYKILDDENIKVYSLPLDHRIPCTGFIFTEHPHPRKINKEAIRGKNLPHDAFPSLIKGKDFEDENGNVFKVDDYTLPAPPQRKYAYLSDTRPLSSYPTYLKDIDLLYHEATFGKSHSEKAINTFHSTTEQAGEIAKKVNAGKLIIGHFSSRYKDLAPLLAEAREIFPNTDLAVEGSVFNVEYKRKANSHHPVTAESKD